MDPTNGVRACASQLQDANERLSRWTRPMACDLWRPHLKTRSGGGPSQCRLSSCVPTSGHERASFETDATNHVRTLASEGAIKLKKTDFPHDRPALGPSRATCSCAAAAAPAERRRRRGSRRRAPSATWCGCASAGSTISSFFFSLKTKTRRTMQNPIDTHSIR